METALVRLSMPGGVGGQRREPLPTRLEENQLIEITATPIFAPYDNVLLTNNIFVVCGVKGGRSPTGTTHTRLQFFKLYFLYL